MTLIVRVYAAEKKARDAAAKLKAEGYSEDKILLMAPKADADPGEAVAAAVASGHLPSNYAIMATDNLKEGRSVVAIDPPFGAGLGATEVLDSFGPVKEDKAPDTTYQSTYTTEGIGLPLLWNGKSWFAGLFGGELSNSAPRAKLSDDPTPLSSRLGMTVLKEDKKDRTHSYGQPLLTSKQYILGEPKLTSEAAPFSARIGMKLLTEKKEGEWTTDSFGNKLLSSDPAPLSSAMGMTVLTKE